jgi:hypothetical protein
MDGVVRDITVHETNSILFELPKPCDILDSKLSLLHLIGVGKQMESIEVSNGHLLFTVACWYEILLTVEWDPTNSRGYRFAHTKIPDTHPLHSEAIEANVLSKLSKGKQLLRGNTFFDPKTNTNSIALEVWQNSGKVIKVRYACLEIRPLTLAVSLVDSQRRNRGSV